MPIDPIPNPPTPSPGPGSRRRTRLERGRRRSRRLSRLGRAVLIGLGSFATALGALGLVLPLLPTTPFLLLAAACFARSSPRFHRKLRSSPVFGPYLRQWRRERTVPPRAKRRAIVLVAATFALTLALVDVPWLRAGLGLLGLGLVVFLARLPERGRDEAGAEPRARPSRDSSADPHAVQVLESAPCDRPRAGVPGRS